MNHYTMKERKCAHCGKNFIPAPYHGFVIVNGEYVKFFCKYTCKLHYEQENCINKRTYAKRLDKHKNKN